MAAAAQDTYFLDWRDARRVAGERNRIPITIAATGSQICYYDGDEAVPDAPPAMIHLPLDRIPEFFRCSDLRMPKAVCFPKRLQTEPAIRELTGRIRQGLCEAIERRRAETAVLVSRIRKGPAPAPDFDRPLWILLPTTRFTTVLQYASRGLARAFERLGHRVVYLIERDDMRWMTHLELLRAVHEFGPHIVIHLNRHLPEAIHPRTIEVSWWQDPVPQITRGQPLAWGPLELAYVIAREPFEGLIERTGLARERIGVQPLCIDAEVFHDRGGPPREEKVVFVGSSARRCLLRTPEEGRLIDALTPRILDGEPLVRRDIEEAAERCGVPPAHAYFKVHHYLIRDLPVRWLCGQSAVPVEVYGRFWDEDEVVAPFFRGEVPHGPAVAEIYRSARYALSCHSQLVQNQRLAEAAACGSIPIVFDCRYQAEPPFWEEQCLFFRTPGELVDSLHREAVTDPRRFQEHYSYEHFARRILAGARARWEAAMAEIP